MKCSGAIEALLSARDSCECDKLFDSGQDLVDKWTQQWLDDRPVFWIKLVPSVLTLLGLILVNLVVDFARARLVAEEGTSAIDAFLASAGSSLKRLRDSVVIYAVPSLSGVALLGLYLLLRPQVRHIAHTLSGGATRQAFVLALLFVGQQAIMLARYWFRVAAWGSEWTFYFGAQ
jgi:hypothetical protein